MAGERKTASRLIAALAASAMAATAVLAAPAGPQPQGAETPAPHGRKVTLSNDPAALPAPVRRLREQIIAAAASGDIERLRPIIDGNGITPTFSFGGDNDPIRFWREVSGDGEGRELLAIMIEVLEAGYALIEDEGQKPIYVWPYFYAVPLDALTPEQTVDLYKLVTAQDVADMRDFGAYIFYRAGITPDGQWQFFVAGD